MVPKTCSIPECGSKTRARGYCNMHYIRWRRNGDARAKRTAFADVRLRLWEKVEKTDTCWRWTGAVDGGGYGTISRDGSRVKVHRLSYELAKGLIDPGMEIDHRCHNRRCVNPDHLRMVTHKQNNENHAGPRADNKSGVRGVTWHKGKWRASLGHHGKRIHVGRFLTLHEAEAAVIARRNELHTHNDLDRIAA